MAASVPVRVIVEALRSAGLLVAVSHDAPEAIAAIADDSRTVVRGGAFIAVAGTTADGHAYIAAARAAGAKSLYVAMFDEIDEGTAIMKCGGPRPVGNFVDLSDVPTDHYLWLSGQAGRMLRGEIPASTDLPKR